jgi:hypothetical protein
VHGRNEVDRRKLDAAAGLRSMLRNVGLLTPGCPELLRGEHGLGNRRGIALTISRNAVFAEVVGGFIARGRHDTPPK